MRILQIYRTKHQFLFFMVFEGNKDTYSVRIPKYFYFFLAGKKRKKEKKIHYLCSRFKVLITNYK